jgi:phosphoglycolate phosphatase
MEVRMSAYRNYLFDLDGTLTDPGAGIKGSIRYALSRFGLPPLEEAVLDRFIGPPLLDSFVNYCGVSREDSHQLLALYREYFSDRGIFENEVYDGIPETLAALRARGAHLFLATSKPEPFALRILEHFGLLPYFDFVGGSTMDETRTDKAEVIAYVLAETGIDPADSVMVGDRSYDVRGGTVCGMDTVGVLYGYGDEAELKEATHRIKTPRELLAL